MSQKSLGSLGIFFEFLKLGPHRSMNTRFEARSGYRGTKCKIQFIRATDLGESILRVVNRRPFSLG